MASVVGPGFQGKLVPDLILELVKCGFGSGDPKYKCGYELAYRNNRGLNYTEDIMLLLFIMRGVLTLILHFLSWCQHLKFDLRKKNSD